MLEFLPENTHPNTNVFNPNPVKFSFDMLDDGKTKKHKKKHKNKKKRHGKKLDRYIQAYSSLDVFYEPLPMKRQWRKPTAQGQLIYCAKAGWF